MEKASGLFGGVLGRAGDALESLAESRWGQERDKAFQGAIEQARQHFHRCARCYQYICDVCWNVEKGLCLNCAPSAEVEIEAARAGGRSLQRRRRPPRRGASGENRGMSSGRGSWYARSAGRRRRGPSSAPNAGPSWPSVPSARGALPRFPRVQVLPGVREEDGGLRRTLVLFRKRSRRCQWICNEPA